MCLYAIDKSTIFTGQQLKLNPLNFTDCNLVFGPVVKFGGPGRLMCSHLLGMLEPASILQVDRHTGSALLLPNCRRINIIEGSGSFLR